MLSKLTGSCDVRRILPEFPKILFLGGEFAGLGFEVDEVDDDADEVSSFEFDSYKLL